MAFIAMAFLLTNFVPLVIVMTKGDEKMIQRKSIALCIVLTLVTCGLYGIYWIITLVNDLNTLTEDAQAASGGVVFLLSLITCDIYWLYWVYKAGGKVDVMRQRRGIISSNTGILYLILSFIGLGIIALALLQNEINESVQP